MVDEPILVTVDDCINIIKSDRSRGQIQKYLYHLLSFPENFETFCRLILPHAFTKPFADFHKEIFWDFYKAGDAFVGAPRGHGKSTEIGQGFTLWMKAYKRFKYLVYTSQNHQKSVDFLEPISREIKTNKLFKFIYGTSNIGAVKDEETGRDREDCFDVDGQRILALSFEKNIRGLKFGNFRPDLIILDDIDDDERVINPTLRAKDMNKLNKQIIPALAAESQGIKMIGTIIHHDCLLAQKLRQHNGKVYKACSFIPGTTQIDPQSILFPDMYDAVALEAKRRSIGTPAFQSEYMNEPVDDTTALIKRDWVESAFDETFSYEDVEGINYDSRYQGVDFAFSDRVTADDSAFVGIGVSTASIDIIQCVLKKGLSITQQFDYIQYLNGIMRYDDNVMEENSIRSMMTSLRDYTFSYTLFWTAAADPNTKKPVQSAQDYEFEGKRHTVGKTAMIKRLATLFENNHEDRRVGDGYIIRIPYRTELDKKVAHVITDQLCTYALEDGKLVEIGPHGDIPIALGLALERNSLDAKSELAFAFAGDSDDEEIPIQT